MNKPKKKQHMKISNLRQTEILKLSVEIRSQLLRESVDKAIEDEEIYMRICDRCESKDSVRSYNFRLVLISEDPTTSINVDSLNRSASASYDLCRTCSENAKDWMKTFDRTFVKDLDPRMPQKEDESNPTSPRAQ